MVWRGEGFEPSNLWDVRALGNSPSHSTTYNHEMTNYCSYLGIRFAVLSFVELPHVHLSQILPVDF